jgi:glycosyltransferase involved in cell wall biosynthesis
MKNTLKVLIVTTAFPRWEGDSRAPFILEAARAIRKFITSVSVIAMHSPGSKQHETFNGIEINRPKYFFEKWEILQKESGGIPIMWKKFPFSRILIFPLLFTQMIATIIYSKQFDIIHANWTLAGLSVWLGKILHNKPFLVTVQGSDIYQATRIPFVRFTTKAMLKKADQVVALSRSLADEIISLGIPSNKISIVPNGVDIRRFSPSMELRKPVILFVGSLIERKGVRYLIEAMPNILQRFPEYKLIIIGEGPDYDKLNHLCQELDINKNIKFEGQKPQKEISQWMRRAKVFVLPSTEEGLGVVLLEAIASGTPCVGTRIGGIQDVISPEVGILVPPKDPFSIEKAIISIIEDKILWENMSLKARERAENIYNWDKIGSQLILLYETIINKKRINQCH